MHIRVSYTGQKPLIRTGMLPYIMQKDDVHCARGEQEPQSRQATFFTFPLDIQQVQYSLKGFSSILHYYFVTNQQDWSPCCKPALAIFTRGASPPAPYVFALLWHV